jgi:hypothetical protein
MPLIHWELRPNWVRFVILVFGRLSPRPLTRVLYPVCPSGAASPRKREGRKPARPPHKIVASPKGLIV